MYRRLKSPLLVQLELTERCSNNCLHCYNYWRERDGKRSAGGVDFPLERVNEFVSEIAAHEVFHIVVTGGEPLLNKKVLFHLLRQAKRAGITVTLNSSLTQLTDGDARLLGELGLGNVLTSILGSTDKRHDAITQTQGSFVKTLRGIRILQRNNVRVSVNMVVSRDNLDDIRATALLVNSLGVRRFNATRVGCPGNCKDFGKHELTTDEFRLYLHTFHSLSDIQGLRSDALEGYPLCGLGDIERHLQFLGRKCLAGITTLTVAANGNARPCSHLDVEYGNVFEDSLETVWHRMDEWARGEFLPVTCQSCKLLSVCSGGCRMEAKMTNGSLTSLDPYANPEEVERIDMQLRKIISSRRNEENKVDLPAKLKLNPKARIRTESFGAVVFVGIHKAGTYNQDAADLLMKLKDCKMHEQVSFLNPSLTTSESNKITRFLSKLYERGIIIGG